MRVSPPHVASNGSTTNNHKLPKPYWRKYSPIAPVNGSIKSECKQCCEYQQRRVHYKLAEKLQSFSVFALFSFKGALVLLSPVTTNRLQHININIEAKLNLGNLTWFFCNSLSPHRQTNTCSEDARLNPTLKIYRILTNYIRYPRSPTSPYNFGKLQGIFI